MKKKFTLGAIILIAILTSCNNKEKKEVETEAEPAKVIETFDVTANVIVKKDDDLIIYFRDETNEWFDEKHAVWQHVKGSGQEQEITFSLPEGVEPNNLRFDFSKNPEQEPVRIIKLKISYYGKSFEVSEDNIKNYFDPNQYVKYDPATKFYTPFKDEKGVYDPFLSINIPFYNEMDKILKGK